MARQSLWPRAAPLAIVLALVTSLAGCLSDDEPSSSDNGDDYTPPPEPEDPLRDALPEIPEGPEVPQLPPPGVVTFTSSDDPAGDDTAGQEARADCGIRIRLLGLGVGIGSCI